ncbi:sensor histidine kinase [Candidatus Pseudoscillospira sp. SGI.172]|uniref:sensor histidine kinase n=1 Tax=Candidatus Pseudoscillospira sp. SGI.172 TaxID=3420582 RepID=UPI003D075DE9
MGRGHTGRRRFFLTLGLTLALVVTGMVMIGRVFQKYESIILTGQDDQMFGLARSVDRSVASYLSRYRSNLIYVTRQRGFQSAVETWQESGEPGQLLERMRDNILFQDSLITGMLALREGEVLLSTEGEGSYRIPAGAGKTEGGIGVRPCIDGDGGVRLAFVREMEDGLSFAALLDLSAFYQRVAGDLTFGTEDRILLLDAGGQTLLHNPKGTVRVDAVEGLSESACDFGGLTYLLEQQRLGVQGAAFYEGYDCRQGSRYAARIAAIPATVDTNGFFAIGVSVNYDGVVGPLHLAAIRLLAYGGMVVAGVLLLVGLTLRIRRRNEEDLRELEVLRKKNEAMEELNRQTQELAHHQRLETIGTLTSSIAHEFNNLLTPIMGYSLLTLEKLPQEEAELYDNVLEIYNASRKAKEIISRLSDLSRKNTALTFQYTPPDELVRRVLEVAAPAQPHGVEVRTEFNCSCLWVYGNELQLSQMLLNLVLNAFQAMERSGGTLRVSTWADESSVFLRVSDTGPGISEQTLPHIFEPFYTTKEAGKGTGLGLAIVRQVVEEHGGTVSVETAVGRGAAFLVSLPLSKEGGGGEEE